MQAHPEVDSSSGGAFEPTVGEQLRLAQFRSALKQASESQLRTICTQLAEQVLVVYPAAMRFLAGEAARNLSQPCWDQKRSEQLLAALGGGLGQGKSS